MGVRLVTWLSQAGYRVIVYVADASNEHDYAALGAASGFEVRMLGLNRASWEAPLIASKWGRESLDNERSRLDFLYLRNEIRKEKTALPIAKHVIISWYLVEQGFLAAQVAQELQIPHIPVVVEPISLAACETPQNDPSLTFVIRTQATSLR